MLFRQPHETDSRPIGVRVFRLPIWQEFLLLDWCRYRLAIARGNSDVSPPSLARHRSPRVWFTDVPSLKGKHYPEHIAHLLSLSSAHLFREHGALVVLFSLRHIECHVPTNDNGEEEPYTDGGAKQWVTIGNVAFDSEHLVFYVEHEQDTDREGRLVDRPAWFFANPLLEDIQFCESVLSAPVQPAEEQHTPGDHNDNDIEQLLIELSNE